MYIKVHLKVCEGCGGLWLRTQDAVSVYCSSCANRFKDFPRRTKRRGRPCKRRVEATAIGGGVQ